MSAFVLLLTVVRFVAEFGGKGNNVAVIGAIYDGLKALGYALPQHDHWYSPSPAEYATLLERGQFRAVLIHSFDRPTPLEGEDALRNYLQIYIPQTLAEIRPDHRARYIEQVEAQLRPKLYYDGVWHADFVRLRVVT